MLSLLKHSENDSNVVDQLKIHISFLKLYYFTNNYKQLSGSNCKIAYILTPWFDSYRKLYCLSKNR